MRVFVLVCILWCSLLVATVAAVLSSEHCQTMSSAIIHARTLAHLVPVLLVRSDWLVYVFGADRDCFFFVYLCMVPMRIDALG